jgi:DNA-binding transcriptional MerR regulator
VPLSRSRDYLSIGEVLDHVRADFPDISISKIRFLESEGLLEPERTDSGYRKFYEKDVDRLRYILTLQRDHFMPLKVIKDRMKGGDLPPQANGQVPPPAPPTAAAARPPVQAPSIQDVSEVQLTRSELRDTSGLTEQELSALEEYGIVTEASEGHYEGAELLIAKAAKGFFALGLEARHLRMYRQFAEREVGFYEQLVSPVSRRKDTEAGHQVAEKIRRLEALSRQIREGMLRSSLRELA